MSCFHRRLSKGMEAFISRMTEAAPAAKRPPHMLLELFPVRSSLPCVMTLLLLPGLGACDKQSPPAGQGPTPTPAEATGPAHRGKGACSHTPGRRAGERAVGKEWVRTGQARW